MAERPLPRLVGPHLLTKVLETDALGEVLRSRRAVPGEAVFAIVRRFQAPGIETAAMLEAARAAAPIFEKLRGSGIAKGLGGFEAEGSVHLTQEYSAGHTLARLIEKASAEGFPIAVDQALLISDKIASALDAGWQFKIDDNRISHRFVVPHLVWITDEGEVRLSGFGFGTPLLAAAKSGPVADAVNRYLAPEVRGGGKHGKSSDVYSVCAILWELLTGTRVPNQVGATELADAELAHDNTPFPKDIAALLQRGLAVDPAVRPETVSDLKKELSKILFAGNYAPTTFNLAFFMNNLFRGEMELQGKEQEKESTLNLDDFKPKAAPPPPKAAGAPAAGKPAPPPPPTAAPTFGADEPPKSKAGIVIGVIAAVAIFAAGGWFLFMKKPAPPAGDGSTAAPAPGANLQSAATAMSPEDFEAMVQRRVDEKLKEIEAAKATEQDPKKKQEQEAAIAALKAQQEELIRKQEEARRAAAPAPAAAATVADGGTKPAGATASPAGPSADEIARKQREAAEAAKKLEASLAAASAPSPSPATTAAATPPPVSPAPQPVATPPAPAAAAAAVKEGDFVEMADVDEMPVAIDRVKPEYPRVAKMRRSEGIVILRLSIDEKGNVTKVELLRKASDDLLNDAAAKSAKDWKYRPAMKDGKKVKTAITDTIPFKL